MIFNIHFLLITSQMTKYLYIMVSVLFVELVGMNLEEFELFARHARKIFQLLKIHNIKSTSQLHI